MSNIKKRVSEKARERERRRVGVQILEQIDGKYGEQKPNAFNIVSGMKSKQIRERERKTQELLFACKNDMYL
jgi:hypothetical protein